MVHSEAPLMQAVAVTCRSLAALLPAVTSVCVKIILSCRMLLQRALLEF